MGEKITKLFPGHSAMSGRCNESSFPIWTEDDRLAALRSLEILDTDPETAFDDIAALAARMCDAPIAVVNFIDEGRQWFKAEIGLGVRETALDISVCAHAILQPGLLVVPDTTKDPRFNGNPLVMGRPHLRFYAGARLETDGGLPLGALCVLDSKLRPEGITKEQGEALLALARAVMSQLKLRQANKALEERQSELAALADALPQMIWSAGTDGRDDYCNRQWYDFTGTEPDAPAGEDWIDFIHPEDRKRTKALWQHALRTGEPYEDEYRLRHHSGEYRWVLSRGIPVRDLQGTTRWLGTNTDIHEWKQAERALARSEERYRALIEAGSPIIWRAAPDGSILEGWGWETFCGPAPEAYKGQGWLKGVHPDDVDRVVAAWQEALASRQPGTTEYRARHRNGEYRWVVARGVPLLSADGAVQEWVGIITDIHDRKQAEEALRASEERLRLALQAGRMFAWEHDLKTNHVTRSDSAMDLLGLGSGPLSDFLKRVDPRYRARRKRFTQQLEEQGFGVTEFRYVRPDGKTLWLASRGEKTRPDRVVGVAYDITERKAAEEELWRLANHDPLTALPNRALFQRRLEQAIAEARQEGTTAGLLLIDLDDFKEVNDSFGHDAGDALLTETAARLSAMVRAGDTVARYGGDEFAVLLAGLSHPDHAAALAESMIKKLGQPLLYSGQMIVSRASIGVAAFPDHDAEPAELMKDADIALYRAKAGGRNRVVTYSPEMRAATEQRIALRREMREAISRDQISPFYQPKVCLSTGAVVGFEALARWRHPTRGFLGPGTFGAAFDDPELATLVGKRLIGKVASDMRRWLDSGLSYGRVAVNLSHAEFIRPGLAEDILRILNLAKVPAERFEIEITEKVLLDVQSDAVSSVLERFRDRGVMIALDDFGTGYASLTHLKQFPVDHIKIDRSFVQDIGEGPDGGAIAAAVIGLGRSLKLQVTAEGVETASQAQRLREMGCGSAQGYLYAKPMAGSDVPEFLSGWSARQAPAKGLHLVEK